MIPPQLLAVYPFLDRISPDSARLLSTKGRLRTIKRGAAVIRRGDRVGGMYFVLAGRLRVFTVSAAGGEAALYFVGPGESCLLATSALFAEVRYPAWVDVYSPEVRIFILPAGSFHRLHESEAAVREFTLHVLTHRVFDLMAAVEEASLESLDTRLRNLLVRHASAAHEVELTHQRIAHSLGTAREVVSRKLRCLEAAGLVETHRGRIRLFREFFK